MASSVLIRRNAKAPGAPAMQNQKMAPNTASLPFSSTDSTAVRSTSSSAASRLQIQEVRRRASVMSPLNSACRIGRICCFRLSSPSVNQSTSTAISSPKTGICTSAAISSTGGSTSSKISSRPFSRRRSPRLKRPSNQSAQRPNPISGCQRLGSPSQRSISRAAITWSASISNSGPEQLGDSRRVGGEVEVDIGRGQPLQPVDRFRRTASVGAFATGHRLQLDVGNRVVEGMLSQFFAVQRQPLQSQRGKARLHPRLRRQQPTEMGRGAVQRRQLLTQPEHTATLGQDRLTRLIVSLYIAYQ